MYIPSLRLTERVPVFLLIPHVRFGGQWVRSPKVYHGGYFGPRHLGQLGTGHKEKVDSGHDDDWSVEIRRALLVRTHYIGGTGSYGPLIVNPGPTGIEF